MKWHFRGWLLGIGLLSVAGGAVLWLVPLRAAEASVADQQLERLLSLTQSAELVVEEILRSIELSGASAADQALYRRFATPASLRRALIPIYRKCLTPQEIAAWLRFYETAEGRSISAKQRDLFRASKEVFLEWGNQLAIQAQNEKARSAVAPTDSP